ncbi:hypothetical protein G6F24_017455 [Rhizopus arrhizus]|nr:hypothetical protein G6F24_017455 [Rhizopus arrhizus]
MTCLNCAGVWPEGVAPWAGNCARTGSCCNAAATSRWILSTMAGGVPAGASSPNQLDASYPFTPASASVGTSGTLAARLLPPTARGTTFPALACTAPVFSTSAITWV